MHGKLIEVVAQELLFISLSCQLVELLHWDLDKWDLYCLLNWGLWHWHWWGGSTGGWL